MIRELTGEELLQRVDLLNGDIVVYKLSLLPDHLYYRGPIVRFEIKNNILFITVDWLATFDHIEMRWSKVKKGDKPIRNHVFSNPLNTIKIIDKGYFVEIEDIRNGKKIECLIPPSFSKVTRADLTDP